MQRIEFEKWEPSPENPNMLQYMDQRAAQEVFEELRHRLQSTGYLPDEYFRMDTMWENRTCRNRTIRRNQTDRYLDEWSAAEILHKGVETHDPIYHHIGAIAGSGRRAAARSHAGANHG